MIQSDIETFLNRVGLKVGRVSKGEYSCYCPWHEDNNASLFINPSKGVYHCFGGCVKGSGGLIGLFDKLDDTGKVTAKYVQVFAAEFPEFLMAIAEENFLRGYQQALDDIEMTMNKSKE